MAVPTKCDFCSSHAVRWRYPARSFKLPPDFESVGDWAACDVCHGLIEKGDREGLLQRSHKTYMNVGAPVSKEWQRVLLQWQRALHAGFWSNRTGAPIKTTSEDV